MSNNRNTFDHDEELFTGPKSPDKKDAPLVEIKPENKPAKETINRRLFFKRGVSIASSSPFTFQEVMLAKETEKEKQEKEKNEKLVRTIETKIQPNYREREVKDVPLPESTLLTYDQLFINGVPSYEIIKDHMLKEGKIEINTAFTIIEKALAVFQSEPNLLELAAPFTLCGDIHGQFYDLVNLFDLAGHPSSSSYLFLGDYVDRGYFSTEVCFLLFTLKIAYPKTFYLLRGNHESRQMTNAYTFKMECIKKYNVQIWEKFMEAFDHLPIAATLDCKSLGTFFCVHGGLSPDISTLDDIRHLKRGEEVPEDGPICDLLWSDPVLEEDMDMIDFLQFSYDENLERGLGKMYGYRAVVKFLNKNNITAIIRAHEVQEEGCLEHFFGRPERKIPMVITLFSAPNYCDMYANKGAFMKFYDSKYEIYQFENVSHPYWLPNFQNAISYTFETVLDEVRLLMISIALLGIEEEDQKDWVEEMKSTYAQKVLKPTILSPTAQEKELQNLTKEQKFKRAKELDFSLEKVAPASGALPVRKQDPAQRCRALRRHVTTLHF